MRNGFAKPGNDDPLARSHRAWSGKWSVWILLASLSAGFGVVTLLVQTTPLARNELGLLGGLRVIANDDILVYVGDRYIGHGTVNVSWNEILGSTGHPPLASHEGRLEDFVGPDAEVLWQSDGPTGVHRGSQAVNYAFGRLLVRRDDGALDHLFLIDCDFVDAQGQWTRAVLPVRARSEAELPQFFPEPGLETAGNISRGMIPSRRDNATFELKLEAHAGAWPTTLPESTEPEPLWRPAAPVAE